MTDVKYDAELCEKLIASARTRYAKFGAVGSADAMDMADQLRAARAEIERLSNVLASAQAFGDEAQEQMTKMHENLEHVRPVVAAAERKRDERDLLGRDKQCSCLVCQAVDAYRTARNKAGQ